MLQWIESMISEFVLIIRYYPSKIWKQIVRFHTERMAMSWILESIKNLNRWHATFFAIFALLLGQSLNRCWPFENMIIYQLLFIPAILLAFFEIQRFLCSIDEFRSTIASHPNKGDGSYISMLLKSYWYFIVLFVVGGTFIYSCFELGYIGVDPTSIYALVMITLVMISAVLGQLCYIYYILLLRKLQSGKKFKYNFYLPARTAWLQLATKTGSRLNNAFFVLGFIYTVVYFLNIKDGYINIAFDPFSLQFSTPNNLVFLFSWIAVFTLVIIAFPIYAWLRSVYINKIVRDLKDISIEEINFLVANDNVTKTPEMDIGFKYYL